MTVYEIRLPFEAPPVTANQNWKHWAPKAQAIKSIRKAASALARAHKVPRSTHITVTLTWHPKDRRRRDADNPWPTLKAACDGLVDAGIVPDDTPEYMTKHTPVIGTPNPKDPHLVLTIETQEATT